jgi:hypothetical protein
MKSQKTLVLAASILMLTLGAFPYRGAASSTTKRPPPPPPDPTKTYPIRKFHSGKARDLIGTIMSVLLLP